MGKHDWSHQLDKVEDALSLSPGSAVDLWLITAKKKPPPRSITQWVRKVMRVLPRSSCNSYTVTDELGVSSQANMAEIWDEFHRNLKHEVEIWSSLDHPNIVTVLPSLEYDLAFYVEYCSNGDIRNYNGSQTPDIGATSLIRDIVHGLDYLHKHNQTIVHGNLNAGKIFITHDGRAKLGEFGLAPLTVRFSDLAPTVSHVGIVRWTSPELLKAEMNDQNPVPTIHSDIWALGCTMFEILAKKLPYAEHKYDARIAQLVLRGDPPGSHSEMLPIFRFPPYDLLWLLIAQSWSVEPKSRPSSMEYLEKINAISDIIYGIDSDTPIFGVAVPHSSGTLSSGSIFSPPSREKHESHKKPFSAITKKKRSTNKDDWVLETDEKDDWVLETDEKDDVQQYEHRWIGADPSRSFSTSTPHPTFTQGASTQVEQGVTMVRNLSEGYHQSEWFEPGNSLHRRRAAEREGKRKEILQKLLDTEQTYVEGLHLVYNHFLAPLIDSLASLNPLVTLADLHIIFPNFIEILNFHRSFLSDLHAVLVPTPTRRQMNKFIYMLPAKPIPVLPALPVLHGNLFDNPPESDDPMVYHHSFPVNPSISGYINSLDLRSIVESVPLTPTSAMPTSSSRVPPLPGRLNDAELSLLARHVLGFKLYKPFVTTFSASKERLASLSARLVNTAFHSWLREKEQHPNCEGLGLGGWLLCVMQRCPRYLMFVKDLSKYTNKEDEGSSQLLKVFDLLSEITGSLNDSIADHRAALALLDLQRGTNSLPSGVSFFASGRTLVRRGRLRMSGETQEALLFSDCMVWLKKEQDPNSYLDPYSDLEWDLSPDEYPGLVGREKNIAGGTVYHSLDEIGPSFEHLPAARGLFGLDSPDMQSNEEVDVHERQLRKGKKKEGPLRPIERIGRRGKSALGRLTMIEQNSLSEKRWRFVRIIMLKNIPVTIMRRGVRQIVLVAERRYAFSASTYEEREEWFEALLLTEHIFGPDPEG